MAFDLSIPPLNHSSWESATMVHGISLCCETMVSYKERLAAALRSAGTTDAKLAAHLDVSIQAVRKVAAGTTVAFTAANNSKAAKFLGVSPDWLATGEGEMRAEMKWPFTQITPVQFQQLTPAQRRSVENFTLLELDRPKDVGVNELLQAENGSARVPGQHRVFPGKETKEYREQRSSDKAEPPRKRGGGKGS